MRKTLFIVALTLLLSTSSVYGASNLWEFYQGQLPPLSERALLYNDTYVDEYVGSAYQNTLLLNVLERPILGSGGVVVAPGTIGVPVVNATAGSVLFADGTADLGEDNTNFFWDKFKIHDLVIIAISSQSWVNQDCVKQLWTEVQK